jgi:hypothetical protein
MTGSTIISTCDELSYPYGKHPEPATKIDKLAKDHNVAVLGTGVNPSFLMMRCIFRAYLELVINGVIHGDIATADLVVNAIPQVVEASPGFMIMN